MRSAGFQRELGEQTIDGLHDFGLFRSIGHENARQRTDLHPPDRRSAEPATTNTGRSLRSVSNGGFGPWYFGFVSPCHGVFSGSVVALVFVVRMRAPSSLIFWWSSASVWRVSRPSIRPAGYTLVFASPVWSVKSSVDHVVADALADRDQFL